MAGLFPGGTSSTAKDPTDIDTGAERRARNYGHEDCLARSHRQPQLPSIPSPDVCCRWDGMIARRSQRITWVKPNRLRDYEMPPADIPLVSHLMTLL